MEIPEKLKSISLIAGVGDGEHTACIMSARALLDGRAFSDRHPSAWLRAIGIRLNDGGGWDSDAERTATLLPLALDERLCAAKCDASRSAEDERRELFRTWARGWLVPFAMDAAASGFEARAKDARHSEADRALWTDHASFVRSAAAALRATPSPELVAEGRRIVQAARSVAWEIRGRAAAYADFAYADFAAADADAAAATPQPESEATPAPAGE